MRLLLVRHGDAEPAAPGGDEDRALTARGQREVEVVAERLRAHDEEPVVILASPLVRARETAAILGRILGRPVETFLPLAPGTSPEEIWRHASARREPTLALVGHEPQMGDLHALLVRAGRPQPFRKAEVRVILDGIECFRGGPW